MKLLLTDSGITNPSIHNALVEMLDKPISESTALYIPTAMYTHPGGSALVFRMLSGEDNSSPMTGLGWKSVAILELTALPSLDRSAWVPLVQEADVLLVAGGDAAYLAHWMRQSGFADLLPTLDDTVYVGLSAGSMVLTPNVGREFISWPSRRADDTTLGIVDFGIFPHVNPPGEGGNSMAEAERWASSRTAPAYVTDGQTAISVVDGKIDVISEGEWRLFNG